MDIAILCIGSLLATTAAWVYLNIQKPKVYELDDSENNEESSELVSVNQPLTLPNCNGTLFMCHICFFGVGFHK